MANRYAGIEATGAASVLRPGHIGVVTVTYNSENVLPEFFDSLASQTCPEYTLYVVDNASKDETLEQCRARADLPIVILPNDSNLGVAEGNNQGIRAALADGCEYVLLLNNDTVFGPQLFAQLRDGLQKHACAMVTPKIYYHDTPDLIWAAGGRFRRWRGCSIEHYGEGCRDADEFKVTRFVTYAPTCCVLIRKGIFDRVGLMDPQYFVYSDDVDFMYRAMKCGQTMKYMPTCSLLHKVSSLTGVGGGEFAARYGTRNRVYFLRKSLPRLEAAFWISIYRAHLFLRYLTGRDRREIWTIRRKAVAEGMAMEVPIPSSSLNGLHHTGSSQDALP